MAEEKQLNEKWVQTAEEKAREEKYEKERKMYRSIVLKKVKEKLDDEDLYIENFNITNTCDNRCWEYSIRFRVPVKK